MTNDEKRYTIRMTPELFEAMRISAEKNRRSIAKEFIFAAEYYLKVSGGADVADNIEPTNASPSRETNK